MTYVNPWTGNNDSPVDYTKPAVEIAADSCAHSTSLLMAKLKIYDRDIAEDVKTSAYMRVLSTFRNWDTDYPFYNFCYSCVHQVYPRILDRYRKSRTATIDTYEDVSKPVPIYNNGPELTEREEVEDMIDESIANGITPAFGTYEEYRKHYAREAIRRRRAGRPRSPSSR